MKPRSRGSLLLISLAGLHSLLFFLLSSYWGWAFYHSDGWGHFWFVVVAPIYLLLSLPTVIPGLVQYKKSGDSIFKFASLAGAIEFSVILVLLVFSVVLPKSAC